jgi:hypothetical protein
MHGQADFEKSCHAQRDNPPTQQIACVRAETPEILIADLFYRDPFSPGNFALFISQLKSFLNDI